MVERTLRHWLAGTLCGIWLACPVRAAGALPPVTPEERAAAFPDVTGTDMHSQMHDDPFTAMLLVEQFEWRDGTGDDALQWDVTGWAGHDMNRLWLRSEGERPSGRSGAARNELLWGHAVAAFWDLVGGVRYDVGPGPAQSYAAFGVQGLAPQWLHVEATAYLGQGGQSGLRLQTDYDWRFSDRLILAGRIEAQAWSEDDARAGIGSGLADASVGLRLRYEIRREFAPYLGVEWQGLFGDTADYARDAGEERRDTSVVAGVRFWF